MTITINTLAEITLNMQVMGNQNALVFQYFVQDWPFPTNAVQGAEGWWNHVKAVTRALASSSFGAVFRSVKIRELNNPTGDYAEYDIPLAEQTGTRAALVGDMMPPFAAVGVRLVVGSRVTRPGQKRVPFMAEADQSAGVVAAPLLALVNTWAALMTTQMTLGAPAALCKLNPIVTRKDPTGYVVAQQAITGWITNPNVTTQNSRKFGRGA